MTTSLLTNNRIPKWYKYQEIWEFFASHDTENVNVGRATFAYKVAHSSIDIIYVCAGRIATLYSDGAVQLWGGNRSRIVKKRLNLCVIPMRKRVISRKGRWYIYTIATGEYTPFENAMIVRPEQ